MTRHDEAVAAYQAELLQILHSGDDSETMSLAIVRAQQALGTEQRLDNTLVEVAADLTKTWGRIRRS